MTDPASYARRLDAILEIAKILVTGQDLDQMLPRLLSGLIDTIDAAQTGVIEIYDPRTRLLHVHCSAGYDPETVGQIWLEEGEAMGGMALQTGRTELYASAEAIAAARHNLRPENRALWEKATQALALPTSAVCVPLIAGNVRVGALVLENRGKPGHFTSQDVPFLQTVADLVALSIENTRLKQELQDTRALEEANRLKAELISTLAHEMRTPLTSIKGFSTALLMDEAAFDPTIQREFLQIVDQECDTLQDLIHDLLESSIIDAGLLKLELQPVSLPRLVQNVIQDLGRRSPRHRMMTSFPAPFPIIDADPHRIEQVLRNLLDNAVKYSPHGGLVMVSGEVRPDYVIVSVADQGVGIAPADLNRLFEKFFRAQSGLARQVIGSGLGLPIARTIIESHGGRIWAESQVGKGSTFYLTLPRSAPDQADPLSKRGDGL